MSSKDIYEASRFLANRYAAGRWRGIGVDFQPTYTRIGTLIGASKQIGTLNGATEKIGTLTGTNP